MQYAWQAVTNGRHGFVGRHQELALLSAAYAAERGELVLLYGRRRIGKTFLLQRFSEERRVLFYPATRQHEAHELTAFTERMRELADGSLPPGYVFPRWEDALNYVADHAGGQRLCVVLDEFPYLEESTPGLASVIQRWWDHRGRDSHIMLVLCGSAQTFMEGLDAGTAPLHQRFTRKIRLDPLSYREAAEFVPALSAADRARVYGILGGTPLYLREWRGDEDLRSNLVRLFGDPASSLVDSARLVLHTDLGDATASYRALSAIANGATKRNEILQRASISNERTLQRLEQLRLIARRVPITEGATSRRGLYVVTDPYFRFWFRFIEAGREAIDRGLGEQLIDLILSELDQYMGLVFEDIARDFVVSQIATGALSGLDVGSWWSSDGQHEIDIVTMLRNRVTAIGTVKWRATPLGTDVYHNLTDHASSLGVGSDIPWLMIGRGGVDPALLGAHGNLRGYSVDDLYAA